MSDAQPRSALLPPGPQRDEAEYEERMASARETIQRLYDHKISSVKEIEYLCKRIEELNREIIELRQGPHAGERVLERLYEPDL